MLRCRIHNVVTNQRYEFPAADLAEVDAKLDHKVKVYGLPAWTETIPAWTQTPDDPGWPDCELCGFPLGSNACPTCAAAPLTIEHPLRVIEHAAERVVEITDITAELGQKAAVEAVQARLDAQAQAWGYDDIFTACTYAEEDEDPQFMAEGKALRRWRSATWRACYANAAAPSLEALIALLPEPPTRPS